MEMVKQLVPKPLILQLKNLSPKRKNDLPRVHKKLLSRFGMDFFSPVLFHSEPKSEKLHRPHLAHFFQKQKS